MAFEFPIRLCSANIEFRLEENGIHKRLPENVLSADTHLILTGCGALLTDGHFVYASGDHGAGWIAKDLVNLDPHRSVRLGELLAAALADLQPTPEILCGLVIGGLICAQTTALAMNLLYVYVERAQHDGEKGFELRRGFEEFVDGREVLVVDDIINTGFSVRLTIKAVRAAGGTVSAVATWINRGNVYSADLDVESLVFLDEVSLPAWPADTCPLCT